MTRQKQFLTYIAYLQIIGIFLVVFGHSFHEYPDDCNGHSLLIYRLFYSFRMPLFLFVSGFLMIHSIKRTAILSVHKFFKLKVKRLIIPLAFLCIITFIPRCILSSMADDAIDLSWHSLIRGLIFGNELIIPFFWFLQTSFLLLTFCYGFISLFHRFHINPKLIFSALFLFFIGLYLLPFRLPDLFSVNQVQRLGIYFVAGACYGWYNTYIDTRINFASPITGVAFCILWISLFFIFENSEFIVFCSAAGICMCISVAKLLEKRGNRLLDLFVGANYMIFLLSWYCNVFSQQILHHYFDFPWWIFTILSLCSGILVPWFLYQLMLMTKTSRLTKIIAFCLGQSLSKTSVLHLNNDKKTSSCCKQIV